MNKLIVYGASGHGKVIVDIAKLNGYKDIIFYDDDLSKNEFDNYKVIHEFPDEDYDLIIAIGNNSTRESISKKTNKELISLIHPDTTIAEDVKIGKGVVIMARAVINPGTVIGDGVIVNTYASLDHDNIVKDYCHISVNAHTAGNVMIGERCFVGIGANIVNNINVCDDATIGAGACVVNDIIDNGTYVGVPAKKLYANININK